VIQSTGVKKTIRIYNSFDAAEKADKEYYRSLTPAQRIAMLLILRDQYSPYPNDVTEGFKRAYRVIKRKQRPMIYMTS
jgi:hypothetical protein